MHTPSIFFIAHKINFQTDFLCLFIMADALGIVTVDGYSDFTSKVNDYIRGQNITLLA